MAWAALLAQAVVPLSAHVISVNVAVNETGNSAVDSGETFGVPTLNTVVGNWNNLSGAAGLVRDDGSASVVGVQVEAAGGYNYFGAGYINTPLNYGMQHYPGTVGLTGLTFSNLQEEFPDGYFAIVYLTGFAGNTGAAITDGSSTYHYQTLSPSPASFRPEDLVQTMVDSPPAAGQAPVAQYAVFGSAENPLTADSVAFSLTVTGSGGAGFGGVQLVAPGENGGGGGDDREWTDPSLGSYFLDAVNGDDNNAGTSPETAWQTLARLDTVELGPGDVVLFRAGDVFVGRFSLQGSGTPESPVVLGAYGTGPKPRLEGGEADSEVILIGGNGGLEIRDLEISNFYPGGTIADRHGIRISAPPGAGDIRHLHFHDLDFKGIMGSGPDHESRAIDAQTTSFDLIQPYTRWNGFVVEDCHFLNIDGRAVQLNDRCNSLTDFKLRGFDYYPTIGFLFQNNTGQNIYRNLLQLSGTLDAVIQYNYMSGTTEGSAFWPFDTEGTVVQFNDFRHLRNVNADSYICHFDYNCIDTLMQYNFGYDVDGGLIEIIVNSQYDGFQEDAVARYNVGVDVGFRDKENSAGIFLTGRITRSWVYNNTVVTTDEQAAYKAISVNNWGGEWPDNNFIHNNLFLATGSPSTFNDTARLSQLGNVLSHNLYYGNISVPAEDLSPVTGDPLLANPGGLDPADLKLTDGSPAIAAGLVIGDNGGRDFFGNPLTPGLVPSIGFHEFQTEGLGHWAGYPIGESGYVDTGRGLLGWIWVGYAGGNPTDWVYGLATHQWIYLPEDNIQAGIGASFYIPDSSRLNPSSLDQQWFASRRLATWVYSFGPVAESNAAWNYVPDLGAWF